MPAGRHRRVAAAATCGLACWAATPAQGGGCARQIASADGQWGACVDPFGQLVDIFPPAQPTFDNVFETLVYEASDRNALLSRRVEWTYAITISEELTGTTFTRLDKSGFPMRIEIFNEAVGGFSGGVVSTVRVTNTAPVPQDVRLFFYGDLDISGLFGDDEALAIFDPQTAELVAIRQVDQIDGSDALWLGACPGADGYATWQIDTFSNLRAALDAGVAQLLDADMTDPGPGDHTAAIGGAVATLMPGEHSVVRAAVGAPGFGACPGGPPCPWDLDGDGAVGIADLLQLLGRWGSSPGNPADFDGDGIVGIADLIALLGGWGVCEGVITPGQDCLAVACGASSADFGAQPIAADFFGPGSDPFTGVVQLRDDPAAAETFVWERDAEVIVPRPSDVATVPIRLIELALVGCAPIVVTHDGGQNPVSWDVRVDLSTTPAPAGELVVIKTHDGGGLFESTLPVQPRYTFTRVDDPNDVRVFDTAVEGLPPIELVTAPAPWVHVADASLMVTPCAAKSGFIPGVRQTDDATQCCERQVCAAAPPLTVCGSTPGAACPACAP